MLTRHPLWNDLLAQQIARLLGRYQRLPVSVRSAGGDAPILHAHVPYMMQTVDILDRPGDLAALAPRHRRRLYRVLEARRNAPSGVAAFLAAQFRGPDGRERGVACGRGSAEDIRRLLQAAVDRGLVLAAGSQQTPTGSDLRAWLKRYGIGVDCTALCQHTLDELVRAALAAAGQRIKPGEGAGLDFLRTGWAYRDVSGEPGSRDLFARVPTLGAARPGDIAVKPGHMRLVERVEPAPGGDLVLNMIESVSAHGIPCGQDAPEEDIGPRRLQVRYPHPERPIGEQNPSHKTGGIAKDAEDGTEQEYIIGRLRALDRLIETHAPPSARI